MSNIKISTYIKLFIIMITLIAASYAWFTNGTRLGMEGLSISTRAVQNLSFSLDGGITWNDDTSLNLDENFEFNSEITGDGIRLYVPSTRREDGTPVSFRNATVNKDYLEFEIQFKSDNPTGIFLDSDSFVHPTAGIEENKLIGSDVLRKSSSGNFSRDLIAGSIRVSFVENDMINDKFIPQNKTKLVWAPNPNYELIKNNNVYTFNLESNSLQDYSYLNPNTLNKEVVPNLKDNINASYNTMFTSGDPMLTYIDEDAGISSITVRIWVEGNDRETQTSLKGGVFRIYLNFIGISKMINDTIPEVSIDQNKIVGLTTEMEYSIDYGNHWIDVINDDLTFNLGNTVYVRYKETKSKYSSEYKILKF